jgi:ssDNA-binding Zn-finger/Zn-ribbon topoisomerase 1
MSVLLLIAIIVCIIALIAIPIVLSKPIKKTRLPYSGVSGVCPKCGSFNIRTQVAKDKNNKFYRDNTCDDCKFEWEEFIKNNK